MHSFAKILIDSFLLLKQQPKLFLPKILIAFLYGAAILALTAILSNMIAIGFGTSSFSLKQLEFARTQLLPLMLLLIYTLAVLVLDVIVNAMYPFLVESASKNQSLFLSSAFFSALKKTPIFLPAVFLVLAAFFITAFPLTVILSLVGKNPLLLLASGFLLSFIFTIAFYLLYPVSTLEKTSPLHALSRTLLLSKKNFSSVSKASLIQLAVTIVSYALAFAAANPAALALFILFRFLIAVLATYAMVLNPLIYLESEGGI